MVERITTAIANAKAHISNLSPEILNVPGMTSLRIRHLLNNICNVPDVKYLEIGMHRGSTLTAAMWKNPGVFCGIDNFSEFNQDGTVKLCLVETLKKFQLNPIIIDNSCWSLETIAMCPFNIGVYFYDGAHDYDSQRQALPVYLHHMDKRFIFIVDDWNWDNTNQGTRDSFKDVPVKILYEQEFFTPGKQNGCNEDWWNGLGIFLLEKI